MALASKPSAAARSPYLIQRAFILDIGLVVARASTTASCPCGVAMPSAATRSRISSRLAEGAVFPGYIADLELTMLARQFGAIARASTFSRNWA
jgi:hypothetical protein